MKKKIAIIISMAISLSMISAFAESDNSTESVPEMYVEVVPDVSETGDITINTEQAGDEGSDTATEEVTPEVEISTEVPDVTPTEIPGTEDSIIEVSTAAPTEEAVPEQDPGLELNESELLSLTTPEGDGWSAAAAMTEKRADCELVIAQGDLYAIGGYSDTGYSYTIEKYNDTDNVWQYVTDIPYNTKGFTAEAVENKIYIFGGYKNSSITNTVLVYDLDTGEWSNASSMEKARDGATSAVIGDCIYVIGGRDASGFVQSYEMYSISTNTWSLMTYSLDKSMIRYGADAEIVNGYLFVWGGLNMDYQYAGMNMYSGTNFRQSQEIVPAGNENITVAWGLDKGLLFIGSGDGNEYSTVEEINMSDEGEVTLNNISFVKEVPRGKFSKCIMYNGYLYSIGGYKISSRSYMNNVYKYSVYYGDFSSGDGGVENIATESGNTLTINAQAGQEYVLFINVTDAVKPNLYTYNIEFPYDSFTVEDAAAFTAAKDTSTGPVSGTDIEVIGTAPDGLSFICTDDNDESYSKTINVVILRATSSGERTITYSMTKN